VKTEGPTRGLTPPPPPAPALAHGREAAYAACDASVSICVRIGARVSASDRRAATGSPSEYEEDHFIPLELGGAPRNPKNLWPEPRSQSKLSDPLETKLKRQSARGSSNSRRHALRYGSSRTRRVNRRVGRKRLPPLRPFSAQSGAKGFVRIALGAILSARGDFRSLGAVYEVMRRRDESQQAAEH
jgi:hypothetical protein